MPVEHEQNIAANAPAFTAGFGRLALLSVGFGCMVGYSRMLSLGFVGYLSQGVFESSDAWYAVRVGACLATLAVLAVAGWHRRLKVGVPALLLATAGAVAAAVAFAVDTSAHIGWAVALVGGASMAVLMYVWMLLLSGIEVRQMVGVGLAGLAMAGALIMGVPYLDFALSLMAAVLSAFVAGAAALLVDGRLGSCAPDGPMRASQAVRVPWITVVMVLVCGFLATVLYGIAQHLTWLYDWAPNYAVFGAAVAVVLASTLAIMARSPRWVHFAWVPQFALLVLALLLACFSVRESIQAAVGLVLACVFCAHFLHWIIFPALFNALRIPKAFMACVVLMVANGSLAAMIGDALGAVLPHSMQNLGGVAGVMVIVLVIAFVLTLAVYRHAFGVAGFFAAMLPGFGAGHGMPDSDAGHAGSHAVPYEAGAVAAPGGDAASPSPGTGVAAVAPAAGDAAESAAPEKSEESAATAPAGGDVPVADGAAGLADIPAPNPLDILQARIDALVPAFGLTPREQEVAFLTVQGFSCGYIAEKLVVSESTVRFHQKNLYRKLDVHSRNELIEFVNKFD